MGKGDNNGNVFSLVWRGGMDFYHPLGIEHLDGCYLEALTRWIVLVCLEGSMSDALDCHFIWNAFFLALRSKLLCQVWQS